MTTNLLDDLRLLPPARMRRVLRSSAGCIAAVLMLSACSGGSHQGTTVTYERPKEPVDTLKPGPFNPNLNVSHLTMLSGGGRAAFAIEVYHVKRLQANVPVILHLLGSEREVLYSTGAGHLPPSLQYIALLRPGQDAWWVDDQIPARLASSGATVRVGTGTTPRLHSIPDVLTTGIHLRRQGGLAVLSGDLINRSATTQTKVAVYAVALRSNQIVAAGRAVVETLPPHGSHTPFQMSLVGDPAGGRIEVTVAPTAH